MRDDREEEITFDYIDRTIACSIIDYDLFDILLNEDEFDVFKKSLIDNVIKNRSGLDIDTHKGEKANNSNSSKKMSAKKATTRGPRSNLRVVINGETIENDNAVTTYIEVLKSIGLERVRKLGITWCKIPLISTEKDGKYHQKYEGGFYVNINSSTERKLKQLYEIADALGIEMHIDMI